MYVLWTFFSFLTLSSMHWFSKLKWFIMLNITKTTTGNELRDKPEKLGTETFTDGLTLNNIWSTGSPLLQFYLSRFTCCTACTEDFQGIYLCGSLTLSLSFTYSKMSSLHHFVLLDICVICCHNSHSEFIVNNVQRHSELSVHSWVKVNVWGKFEENSRQTHLRVMIKNVIFEVTVTLDFDLFSPSSNQFILQSKWMFVPHVNKFLQSLPEMTHHMYSKKH